MPDKQCQAVSAPLVHDAALASGLLIAVRPVGMLEMVDQEEPDQKVLAVPNRNPRYDQIHTIDQVFPHKLRQEARDLIRVCRDSSRTDAAARSPSKRTAIAKKAAKARWGKD